MKYLFGFVLGLHLVLGSGTIVFAQNALPPPNIGQRTIEVEDGPSIDQVFQKAENPYKLNGEKITFILLGLALLGIAVVAILRLVMPGQTTPLDSEQKQDQTLTREDKKL